jgi:hypothetical protein
MNMNWTPLGLSRSGPGTVIAAAVFFLIEILAPGIS